MRSCLVLRRQITVADNLAGYGVGTPIDDARDALIGLALCGSSAAAHPVPASALSH